MAYVTPRPNGTWELRESVSTPAGPRSRTLASFRTLSDEAIEAARSRAAKPLGAEEVRRAARRAGAPVGLAAADRAAGDLLRELDAGREPHPILRRLLVEALQAPPPARLAEAPRRAERDGEAQPRPDPDGEAQPQPDPDGEAHPHAHPGGEADGGGDIARESLDNARASAAWLTATPADRGRALYDLLLLGESLQRGRPRRKRFPRLEDAA